MARKWTRAVLTRYWAIQLPSTALAVAILLLFQSHLAWPQWIVWTLVALWVAKDAVLYPFVWRAYDPDPADALPYPIEGARGTAIERIAPSGQVRVWGELWRAELAQGARGIEQGETVKVDGRRGLTLLVHPDASR
jgi:membrane protein implicated in regulation of membrane protease activity